MAREQVGITAWVRISESMRARVRDLGGDAVFRLDSFGMDDRREAAIALLLAGGVPYAGMYLWDWGPVATLAALLINLLINQAEDISKLARGRRYWAELNREAVEDEFVWPLAVAMASGRETLHGTALPTEEDVDRGYSQSTGWWVWTLISVFSLGFCAFLLQGEGAIYAEGNQIMLGVLPSLLLALLLGVFHGFRRDPHWHHAASVRLQCVAATAAVTGLLGGICLVGLATSAPDPPFTARGLANVACIAVIVYGLVRVTILIRLHKASRWLASWLQGFEQGGPEQSVGTGKH